MKKKTKKLALNRDTLLSLDQNLWQVAGGTTQVDVCGTRSCAPPYSHCEYSGQRTCNTCAGSCTTNLC
jgi:hypothetical protein